MTTITIRKTTTKNNKNKSFYTVINISGAVKAAIINELAREG